MLNGLNISIYLLKTDMISINTDIKSLDYEWMGKHLDINKKLSLFILSTWLSTNIKFYNKTIIKYFTNH